MTEASLLSLRSRRPIPLLVCSRRDAERYVPGENEVCISISDPHVAPASLSPAFAGVLRLVFDDIEAVGAADDVLFDAAVADAVLAFLQRWGHASRIVIHCHGGASRSPAIALGIADVLEWPTQGLEDAYPAWNRWVRAMLRQRSKQRERPHSPISRALSAVARYCRHRLR